MYIKQRWGQLATQAIPSGKLVLWPGLHVQYQALILRSIETFFFKFVKRNNFEGGKLDS